MSSRKPDDPGTDDDPNAWSRAPRVLDDSTLTGGPVALGTALARELAAAFRTHVQRALGASSPSASAVALDDSETSLAFVDHYLRTVLKSGRGTPQASILALIAAEAGAYYGELVCKAIGGTWIGDGKDPRRLRLLIRDQFLHFSPIDQALEVLLGRAASNDELADDDVDLGVTTLDTEFHARRRATARRDDETEGEDEDERPREPDDASWLAERLAEIPEVSEDEYFTLTCRFETLKLVLELLATKHASEGKSPREYHIGDYVEALAARD